MKELTGRERLTRLFEKQPLDRMPVWLLSPYHPVSYYADIYRIPSYEKVVEKQKQCCDIFDRRSYDTGVCYNGNPEIKRESKLIKDENGTKELHTITYRDFSLQRYIYRGKGGTRVKYFVEDLDELQALLEIPYRPVLPDISHYAREKEELGAQGLMMVDIGDPLCPIYHLMSAENFSIFSLTDYERLLGFLDVIYERTLDMYRYLLDHGIGEVFFLVGAEFAGPPLVSPSKFSELCVRYVKGIVDLVRSYGKKSILHYHGQLYDILDGIKEIGPDGLHTIEAPPVGNCTLAQAREKLGDMILIGNIQYDDLVHKEAEEIDAMVKAAIGEAGTSNFILSPTAGPYEAAISEKTAQNYLALIDAGMKYGQMNL